MDYVVSKGQPGYINLIESYYPLAGARGGQKRIPIELKYESYEKDYLILFPHNSINAFGKIVAFGDNYISLRPDILKYELKFSKIGGIFSVGCDGTDVEISTAGMSSHKVIMSVSHFMDTNTALEAFFEAAVYLYSKDLTIFHEVINSNYVCDIEAVQEHINGYFNKN